MTQSMTNAFTEGDSITFSGRVTGPVYGNLFMDVDWNGVAQRVAVTLDTSNGYAVYSVDLLIPDDYLTNAPVDEMVIVYTLVSVAGGGQETIVASGTQVIAVQNAAPEIRSMSAQKLDGKIEMTLNVFDRGAGDTFTSEWYFGGAASEKVNGVTLSRTLVEGLNSVMISVTDDDGGTDTFYVLITVSNGEPTVAFQRRSDGTVIQALNASVSQEKFVMQAGIVNNAGLSPTQLVTLVEVARSYWNAAGLTEEQRERLLATQIVFEDMPANALGCTGISADGASRITLDNDAAGMGWFVDETPYGNEEFELNAHSELVAKTGYAPERRYDMLTVLLHEMGHVLGLDDIPMISGQGSLMTSEIGQGIRRTPSWNEQVALVASAGVAKSSAYLQASGDEGSIDGQAGAGPQQGGSGGITFNGVQYQGTPNATLVNNEFNSVEGWTASGSVSIGGGTAVLQETADGQTRLNQVFVLGEHDRFLSFTLANIALENQETGPDDAFEVGLLDADTGASLFSGIGLTRTDAVINLQTDGAEFKAQNISRITNADGSRTYLLDLSGIAAGTAINLSFDLIGFGRTAANTNSRITVRDLRLGVPQPMDDVVSLMEDAPALIDALANDLDARQPGFSPLISSSQRQFWVLDRVCTLTLKVVRIISPASRSWCSGMGA